MNKIEMGKNYRTRDGHSVRVLCVDANLGDTNRVDPVVAIIRDTEHGDRLVSMSASGKWNADLTSSCYDLIEVGPYDDFKIDEPVMVSDVHDINFVPQHFAGVAPDGKPTTWQNGGTSWTTTSSIRWRYCRRPTPEELK